MEGDGVSEKQQTSYTYWVREAREDAAPLPVPRKLSADDMSKQPQSTILGSVWNQVDLSFQVDHAMAAHFLAQDPKEYARLVKLAGTWEERNLNSWASSRIKELLSSLGSLEFSGGKASIDEVSKCSGDAFLVTVRNKKRVGYAYELTLKFKGEWLIQEEKKIKGHLDIPEFSFGELDNLQIEVRLSDEKGLSMEDRMRICKDLRLFLTPIREQLLKFEEELKDR